MAKKRKSRTAPAPATTRAPVPAPKPTSTSTHPPTLLITGGAGYIGCHATRLLAAAGEKIIVLDSMERGHPRALVSKGVMVVESPLSNPKALEYIFTKHRIDAVLHFAAYALVDESVKQPLKYYQNNFAGPLLLLDAMRQTNCRKFIFSSTCATYGNPQYLPMDEAHPQLPINPYGASKLMFERALQDCESAWGLKSVILRYFNACGGSEDGRSGEDHEPETHLIPRALLAALGRVPPLTVFGTDFPTPDGTCIRDYISVLDLADAHAAALRYLRAGHPSTACNLGTGQGFSVKEIIQMAEEVCGQKIPAIYGDRREGDPPQLVCNPAKALTVLGWSAKQRDPRTMIAAAWKWLTNEHGGKYPALKPEDVKVLTD